MYGALGTSASPSGFVLYPSFLLSSGFSVSRAPVRRSDWRKSLHRGLRFESCDWNSSRGISLRQERQTRLLKKPWSSIVGREGCARRWKESTFCVITLDMSPSLCKSRIAWCEAFGEDLLRPRQPRKLLAQYRFRASWEDVNSWK